MIRFALVALAAVLAATSAGAQSAGGAVARLKAEATVTGELVRIGDLVDNAGATASIPIFRAPDLGETGSVPAARVIEAAMLHGLVAVDGYGVSDVVVRRASRTIPIREVEARIARALAVRYGLGDGSNIAVTFDREVRPIQLEPSVTGALQPTRVAYDQRSGRFDATFEIADGAGPRVTMRYSGAAAETLEAAVPVRPLARGEILKASDIVVERRPKAQIAADTVRDAGNAVGLAARRPLRPGQPLHAADLMKPEIVQRNEPVTLVYQAPGLVLTIHGKALEAGTEGDLVNVLNTQSKRTVQGTVVGPGRVAVGLAPGRLAASATPPASATPDGAPRRGTE